MSHVGEVLDERYELVELIGQGGMGVVYLAEHLGLRDPGDPSKPLRVAVKVIAPEYARDDELRKRLQIEANALNQLRHENVVGLVDYVPSRISPYLVLEYVCGPGHVLSFTLHQELQRGLLSPTRALDVSIGVARGMEAAHAAGVLHRDLKPSNVLIDAHGRPRVTDFGIARFSAALSAGTTGFVGTPDYAAPEQFSDAHSVDVRADVYAVGKVLYKVLTGTLPRPTEPRPPSAHRPGLWAQLDRLVMRAVARDPNERFATMMALRSSLEELAAGRARRHALRWQGAEGLRVAWLYAQDHLLLGRDVDENDLVLQFMPQTESNRERTRSLSRIHCHLDRDGGRWVIADERSTKGTHVNGVRVRAGEPILLEPGAQITLGPYMMLRYTECRTGGRLRAGVLHRMNNLAETERYVLVESGVEIGSSRSAVIPISGEAVRPVHARLVPRDDGYALEALHPGVTVGGEELRPGRITPLSGGARFDVAGTPMKLDRV